MSAQTKQGHEPQSLAAESLNQGALQYKEGNFAEAQKYFERALELDPANKDALLFIARAIHAQYRPRDESAESVATAEAAIEAYKRALERDPDSEDAYNAVAYLYRQMKDEARERDWLLMLSNRESLPAEKRSNVLAVLASKEWNCSFKITEANKITANESDAGAPKYKKPDDEADFYQIQRCATRGLNHVEQAINLNRLNPNAWSYKTNLLRELSKFAQMEGNEAQREFYDQQASEAESVARKLSAESERTKKVEAVEGSAAGPVGPVNRDENIVTPTAAPREKIRIVRGGVLNGKAVVKPVPVYPREAKEAKAAGMVAVEIVVDEEGRVVEAKAVSGHPLLRQAAVEAARQARLSPTLLQGKPIKVTGVLTYNFVLR